MLLFYLLRFAFHVLFFLPGRPFRWIHGRMKNVMRDNFPSSTWNFYLHWNCLFIIPFSRHFCSFNIFLKLLIHSCLLSKNLRPKILSRKRNVSSLILCVFKFAIALISCWLIFACSWLIWNGSNCLIFFIGKWI